MAEGGWSWRGCLGTGAALGQASLSGAWFYGPWGVAAAVGVGCVLGGIA